MPVLPDSRAFFPRAAALLGACALLALTWPGRASAEEQSVVAAANAYAQAQQAELKGDHDRAAELFELADRIAPTPEALRSATRARLAAGQLALAADDAALLLSRDDDPASTSLAEEVLAKARPELTQYTFECSEPCTIVVDRIVTAVTPLETQVVHLAPGSHDVEVGFDDDAVHRLRLTGAAGEARTLDVARPAPRDVASVSESEQGAPAPKRGLHQAYFWSAAAATVVVGGITLWSGLDLLKARDDFNDNPTQKRFDDGQAKDLRTSVLLGVTGALAATTVTLAVFTRFKRDDARATASIGSDGRGAQLQLRGSF